MRSLWGLITPNVRKVSVSQIDDSIVIHFYYDKEPTELEAELSEEAASELIANYSDPFLISCKRLAIESPRKIEFEGSLIYSRFE